MERRLGLPCVGIIPYLPDLGLDEEDGVALEDRPSRTPLEKSETAGAAFASASSLYPTWRISPTSTLWLGAVGTPSPFLEHPKETAPIYSSCPAASKPDDLEWLDREALPGSFAGSVKAAFLSIGICGGFQMLGSSIEDPHGIENQGESCEPKGLGFLPVRTVLHRRRPCGGSRLPAISFRPCLCPETRFEGYEIHVGETFMKPDLVLLRISCAREFPAPFRTAP
jgi:adenosylcobyric acid synthase